MRSPETSSEYGSIHAMGGTRGSRLLIRFVSIERKTSQRSATVRASGPDCARTASCPAKIPELPRFVQRSSVGFSAVMPQKCAGMRRLPPMSVPRPSGDMPDAMAAASPPDDPPGVWERRKGLFVSP